MFKFLCASLLTMGFSSSVFAAHVNAKFTNSYTGSGTVTVVFTGDKNSTNGTGIIQLSASPGSSSNTYGYDLTSGTTFTAHVPITYKTTGKGGKVTNITTNVTCTNNGSVYYTIPGNDISIQMTYSSGGMHGTCSFTAQ